MAGDTNSRKWLQVAGMRCFRWPLWIRRVLVRAQEGQLAGAKALAVFLGSAPGGGVSESALPRVARFTLLAFGRGSPPGACTLARPSFRIPNLRRCRTPRQSGLGP
jgi:hypothetical protein